MFVSNSLLFGKTVRTNPIPDIKSPCIQFKGFSRGEEVCFGIGENELSRHILLVGGTGSGKTNAIYQMVAQLKKNMTMNDVMIIFDTKGDYYNRFYTYGDTVISSKKNEIGRAEHWNIYKEIVADGWDDKNVLENATEISTSLFKEQIDNSNQTFFPNAARDLFAAILIAHLRLGKGHKNFKNLYLNNKALKEYLNIISPQSIQEFLHGFSDLSYIQFYIGDGNNEQGLGVLGELQSVIRQLFLGTFAENGGFSIRKFVREKSAKTLFVEYDLSIGMTLVPVYRLLFDLVLKEALGREKKQGNVYLICDEFKLLPNMQHIEDAVNFGRSMGVKVVAGIQSIEQLYEIYGNSRGRNIAAGFSNIFAFKTNDVSSRKYVSDLYGSNIILEQYYGMNNKMVEEKRIGKVVEDWDISQLGIGEAIIGLSFCDPFVFKFNEY